MTKQLPQHGEWDGKVPAHPLECERSSTEIMYRKRQQIRNINLAVTLMNIQDVVTRWQRMDGPKAPDAMGEIRAILEGK